MNPLKSSVALTNVTCCQELSGLTNGGARPGKLVHHHHNLTYVHSIYECYTFYTLSAIYSVRVRQFDQPDERVDELETARDRPHKNVV